MNPDIDAAIGKAQQSTRRRGEQGERGATNVIDRFRRRCARLAIYLSVSCVCLFQLGGPYALAEDHETVREPLPKAWKNEAELTSVFFLTPELGWAVGAQGALIRTTDGGDSWNEISNVASFQSDQMALGEKLANLRAGRRTATSGMSHETNQREPLRCRFESVHFVDALHGWAAGGYQVPYLNRSRAVIMKTEDGGKTWNSIEGLAIPRLRKVQFQNRNEGWAIGDSGNLFASGVYFTSDGGQTWSSNTNQNTNGWRTAAAVTNGYVVIDAHGKLGHIQGPDFERSVILNVKRSTSFKNLLMLDDENGVAVGTHGVVVRTANGGKSWQSLDLTKALPDLEHFDLTTVTMSGQKLWFAGMPGTHIISLDLVTGVTQRHRTPGVIRINDIQFSNDKHGVAVGDAGSVLLTSDGGQTWNRKRGSPGKTAIMMVASNADQLPIELLAKYSVEENRICRGLILSDSLTKTEAAQQAFERLGGYSCDALEIVDTKKTPPELTPEDRERLVSRLAKMIRVYRPLVVVTDQTKLSLAQRKLGNRQTESMTSLLDEAIERAADDLNDPTLRQLEIMSHRVKRLATQSPFGTVKIKPQYLLARTGQMIEDTVSLSRALLGRRLSMNQPIRFHVKHLNQVRQMDSDDFLSRLGTRSSIPTRPSQKSLQGNIADIRNANQRSTKLNEFLKFETHGPNDIQVWRRNLNQYVVTIDRMEAASWLMRLAERYHQQGKMELAAQTVQVVATRWSESPYALAAQTWLIEYYASDEFGHLEFRQNIADGRLTRDGKPSEANRIANQYMTQPKKELTEGMTKMTWTPVQTQRPAESQFGGVAKASFDQAQTPEPSASRSEATGLAKTKPAVLVQRLKIAARFLSSLKQRDPELTAGLYYQWLDARIAIRLSELTGLPNTSSINTLKRIGEYRRDQLPASEWTIVSAAKKELELLKHSSDVEPQTPTGKVHTIKPKNNRLRIDLSQFELKLTLDKVCRFATTSPVLDGRLEEAFWNERSDRSAEPNHVRFRFDDEYLYLGIVCSKLPGVDYEFKPQRRPRDADLSRRDRVAISIDTDRDYWSGFKFEIDHRGWVNESCDHLQGWNPEWFVGRSETASAWIIEAAIPLEELIASRLRPGATWMVGVNRLAGEELVIGNSSTASAKQQERPLLKVGVLSGAQSQPMKFQVSSMAASAVNK